MDPFQTPDQPGNEPNNRRARRKNSDPPPPPPAGSTRGRRGGKRVLPPGVQTPRPDSSAAADAATIRLASFAHEIAGLIDGAMRSVSLTRAGIRPNAAQADADIAAQQLDAATAALERMAEIVRAAMQPCAGQAAGSVTRSLREAVEHAAEALRPLAEERGATVEVACSPALGEVPAGALYAVIASALRNAIEATGPGGKIELRADLWPSDTGGEVRIDVIDEGVGPPPRAGAKVFDPGFTTKPSGVGLGLALSRDIVREMGGEIELIARMEGRRRCGAHLRVRCPAPAAH